MGNKVVWLIGLSGAGKTTIAEAACERYGAELLDGDTIRDFFSNQDFSREGGKDISLVLQRWRLYCPSTHR